jgi:biotin carboxylase
VVLFVDAFDLGLALPIAERGGRRGVDVAIAGPPSSLPEDRTPFVRVFPTDDLGLGSLRAIAAELDGEWDLRGLYSSFGPYRPEGFVHGTVATVATERGLPTSPATALARATNKYLARDAFRAAGLPDIRFALAGSEADLDDAVRHVGFPLVLKPLTGVGSSVILKCGNHGQARAAFRRARELLPIGWYPQLRMAQHREHTADGTEIEFDPTRMVLVEEYICGREASVECVVVGDSVHPLIVHDKLSVEECATTVYEHVLIAPPERFTPNEVCELREHAAASVRAIGLRDRLCHVELRYRDGAGPRVLEVNPRVGAGAVADSFETFCGIDTAELLLDLVMGTAIAPQATLRTTEPHAMVFLFAPRAGRFLGIDGLRRVQSLEGVTSVRVMHPPGAAGGDHEEQFLASVWARVRDGAGALALRDLIASTTTVRFA